MLFLKTGPMVKAGLVATALAAASLAFSAPAAAHGRRGGGNDAAIAIGAGVVGLAIGAAVASNNNDIGYYPADYYAPGYYPVYGGPVYGGPVYGGPVYRGPVYRGPVYRGGFYGPGPGWNAFSQHPAWRGNWRFEQERRWRAERRWERRQGWRGW